jgi:hypothetical protein
MTTPFQPVIRSQSDLEAAWRQLIRPLGFHRRSLWLLLIGADDRPTPVITEVTDLPELFDADTADGLADGLLHLTPEVDPEGRWAFLCSRPGGGGATEADRAWAGGLYATCRRRGLAHDVIHLATDTEVLPIPLDDVTDYVQAS